MKRLLILVLLLGGCSSGPVLTRRVCWERSFPPMTVTVVDGQVYPTCINPQGESWCQMKVEAQLELDTCTCKRTCPCKQ